MDDIEKQDIVNNMDMLKRRFVNINKSDIENVKQLIRSYGATYYDAPGEADELCAMLTIKGKVWACLSEDMDLFVYGCTRVLRYFSLMGHTAVLYYMKGILEEIKMTGVKSFNVKMPTELWSFLKKDSTDIEKPMNGIIIDLLKKYGRVFITSEKEIEKEKKKYNFFSKSNLINVFFTVCVFAAPACVVLHLAPAPPCC